ncbi:MAG: uracil-DNA glycosylase [Pirellulaceae bacterium]|nr:uracil-DNA glycosylase [Planctomycetales bacterium]
MSDTRALQQQLASLQRAGVTDLPLPRPGLGVNDCAEVVERPTGMIESSLEGGPVVKEPIEPLAPNPHRGPSIDGQRAAALNVIAQEVASCELCPELASSRTQTVFGVGNPHARLCFFGEAPGADEDRIGEPFVGRAGQLLDKIIQACTLRREDVYILNVLKCRPPGNRNPAADEVACCRAFFERQLEIIQPEFICCLGSIAATNLLETTQTIGKLRGRFHQWRDIKVIATYHPAYLLRNPSAKAEVWKDMQMLMREMGIPLSTDNPGQ